MVRSTLPLANPQGTPKGKSGAGVRVISGRDMVFVSYQVENIIEIHVSVGPHSLKIVDFELQVPCLDLTIYLCTRASLGRDMMVDSSKSIISTSNQPDMIQGVS